MTFDFGLLSPATAGADGLVSDASIRLVMIEVEIAHLRVLERLGIAPAGSASVLEQAELIPTRDVANRAVLAGNPLIPLLTDLRSAVAPSVASWVHKGATSQDILDTSLMLAASRCRTEILGHLETTVQALSALAESNRATVAAARTLTQHSTPTTWGLRFSNWLTGILDARDALAAARLPVQAGGASGTLASIAELSDPETALQFSRLLAAELGLAEARPWHTSRSPITRLGDALATVIDSLGVIAANVATQSRTEIAELAEPAGVGRGVSSAMPQKRNPVLSILIRSTSFRAPGLAATLHLCATNAVDERPDGAWHAEWPTLRELLRLTIGASALASELVSGLTVDRVAVQRNLDISGDSILAERVALSGSPGTPETYVGVSDALIDEAVRRANS